MPRGPQGEVIAMRRWTRWAASAAGAAGAGAGIALARHRRRPAPPAAHLSGAPAPAPAAVSPEPPPAPADDPQAALDAARQRLRDRADDLRRDIEASGGAAEG